MSDDLPPPAAPVTALACPRDGAAMLEQPFWRHPRHRCRQCGGVFLGREHLAETLGPRAMANLERHASGIAETAAGPVSNALPRSLVRCPRDGAYMAMLDFKGAQLKICTDCRSVWLPESEHAKMAVGLAGMAAVAAHGATDEAGGQVLDGIHTLANTLEFARVVSEVLNGLAETD